MTDRGRRVGWRRAVAVTVGVAALVAGATPVASLAATADVTLRVEGRAATLYEGTVRTAPGPYDGGDGTGAHACNAAASPAGALAGAGLSWAGTWYPDFQDFFLDRVGADVSDPATVSYWSILVDWRYAAGLCRATVGAGGEVLVAYGPGTRVLRLDGPSHVDVGEPFAVTVRDGALRSRSGVDGGPVAGATVGDATTGADGRATLRFATAGRRRLKATAPNAIRSNAIDVCVGDAHCQALPEALNVIGTTPGSTPTPAVAPPGEVSGSLTIAVPDAGTRYARGGSTLLLRGRRRRGGSAAAAVTVALRGRCAAVGRHCVGEGDRCVGLRPDGLVSSRPCGHAIAAVNATTDDGTWSLKLRRRLPPGRYRLLVAAGSARATRSFTVTATPTTARDAASRAERWLTQAALHRGGRGGAQAEAWTALALGRGAGRTAALARVRAHARETPALSALALASSAAAADRALQHTTLAALLRRQRADGSWAGESAATAIALLALRGHARHRTETARGRAWLRTHATTPAGAAAALWALRADAPPGAVTTLRAAQADDGGFAPRAGAAPDIATTVLALIGLRAAGVDPATIRPDTGVSGLDYLRARQAPSGRFSAARPVLATAQALLALTPRSRRLLRDWEEHLHRRR